MTSKTVQLLLVFSFVLLEGTSHAFFGNNQKSYEKCITNFSTYGYRTSEKIVQVCKNAKSNEYKVAALQLLASTGKSLEDSQLHSALKIKNKFAVEALDSLIKNGHPPLDWLMKICSKIKTNEAATAIKLIVTVDGQIISNKLNNVSKINSTHALSCIEALTSEGYKIAETESSDAINLCSQAKSKHAVAAIRVLAGTEKKLLDTSIKIALTSDNQFAVEALESFIKHYPAEDWVLKTCVQVKTKEPLQAIQWITQKGGTLSSGKIQSLLYIKSKTSLRCIEAFISNNYSIAKPSAGDTIKLCQQVDNEYALAAIESLTATRLWIPDDIMKKAVKVDTKTALANWKNKKWLGEQEPAPALMAEPLFPAGAPDREIEADQVANIIAASEALANLSLEDFSSRVPQASDLFYYPEILADIDAQPSSCLSSETKKALKEQILFEKALLLKRSEFLQNAGKKELSVWHYNKDGSYGAFHAEHASENRPWAKPEKDGKIYNQPIPMKNRLNYVHNALLKSYLKAKQDNKLMRYFMGAFDISRYCIDARTEYLVKYLLENSSTGLERFNSLKELYEKEIQNHMAQCQIDGKELSEASLREAFSVYVGQKFRDQTLDVSFVDEAVRLAKKWALL